MSRVLLLIIVLFMIAAPAEADECMMRYQYANEGWQGDLSQAVTGTNPLHVDTASFDNAVLHYTQAIEAFDSIKPGPIDRAALDLSTLESGLRGFQVCAHALSRWSGTDPLPQGQVIKWSAMLDQRTTEFFQIFGKQWEASIFDERLATWHEFSPEMNNLEQVYISAILRHALKKVQPDLLVRADNTFEAHLTDSSVGNALRQLRAMNEQSLRVPAIIAAARKNMPATINGWTRVSTHSYMRQAPAGIRETMTCSTGDGRGLILELDRTGGTFVHGPGDTIAAHNLTHATVNMDGKIVETPLGLDLTDTSDSTDTDFIQNIKTTTTTYTYDPQKVFLSLQSGQGIALMAHETTESASNMVKTLARSMGVTDTSTWDIIMDAYLSVSDVALPAMQGNIEIDTFKNIRSAKLSVTVQDADYNVFPIDLGDLSPQQAPFNLLMRACHGEDWGQN